MWGRSLRLWAFAGGRPPWQQAAATRSPVQPRLRLCASAAGGAAAGALQQLARGAAGSGGRLFAGGTLLGGGAVLGVTSSSGKDNQELEGEPAEAWLVELASRPNCMEVLSAGQQFRKGPLGKLLLDQDHLFEVMEQSQQIREFRCFYEAGARRFHSVVRLGREVCGFPQVVHGGLTAALVDETFGGLGLCLWRSGALGVRPPAYTARLEVDYKRKIPAGSTILVTTELERVEEGRKIWMTAQVSDGRGTVYATSRALFVAPKLENVLFGWLPFVRASSRQRPRE